MTKEEKYVAHLRFKCKILEISEQVYEDFFVEIMGKHNPNFQPVNPQGAIGDKKNDGFDKQTGTYYQVYAPENLDRREAKAVSKLVEDFEGLLNYWQNISPVKSFYYVLHDRYKGAYPTTYKALAELEAKHKIQCQPFLNKDLEDTFWQLNDDKIVNIVGFLPNISMLENVEFSALKEVVEFLMEMHPQYHEPTRPDNLNFNEKIKFNKLSNRPANLLKEGDYQKGNVEEYFRVRSSFEKNELRNRFVALYTEGCQLLPDSDEKNDAVFFRILEKASPRNAKAVQDAVIILMAYYFECCDIFEEPFKS